MCSPFFALVGFDKHETEIVKFTLAKNKIQNFFRENENQQHLDIYIHLFGTYLSINNLKCKKDGK